MISEAERKEVIKKGQEDGRRLYNISETIYKRLIALNWIFGILGGIVGIITIARTWDGGGVADFSIGAGILAATAVTCFIEYASALLITQGAKVLVNLLYSNLMMLEDHIDN